MGIETGWAALRSGRGIGAQGTTVTRLLEQALSQVEKLPASEQDALAAIVIEELASERRWAESFAKSQDVLSLSRRLEEVPDLVGGMNVPVRMAEQAKAVHLGMRRSVAAAFDGVERDTGLAGCGS